MSTTLTDYSSVYKQVRLRFIALVQINVGDVIDTRPQELEKKPELNSKKFDCKEYKRLATAQKVIKKITLEYSPYFKIHVYTKYFDLNGQD